MAAGLCSGFYMCGRITQKEWEVYLKRIPDESLCYDVAELTEIPDPAQFKQFLQVADRMIELADKEQMADCARLLALDVAHYEMRYGGLPLEAILATTDSDQLSGQQVELVARSMVTMARVLGNVLQGFEAQVTH